MAQMCATHHFWGQGSLAVRSPTAGLPRRRAVRLQPVRLKSRSVAVLAVSALAVAAAIVPAVAATPGSGSVSDTSPTATWTAGPFAVPNVTGQTGEVSCTA